MLPVTVASLMLVSFAMLVYRYATFSNRHETVDFHQMARPRETTEDRNKTVGRPSEFQYYNWCLENVLHTGRRPTFSLLYIKPQQTEYALLINEKF